MSSPSSAQIARWESIVNEILERNLDPWHRKRLIRSELGEEYNAYMKWFAGTAELKLMQFLKEISPAEFARILSAMDYNNWESIYQFRRFLNRPNIMSIVIGNHNRTLRQLAREPGQLEPYERGDGDDTIDDRRMMLGHSALGLWSDQEAFRRGIHSDEGSQSGEPTYCTPAAQAPLEVFHQIGLLYSSSSSSMSHTDLDGEEGWRASNYVLVVNIYDRSIWVLWRKFVHYLDCCEHGLAKQIWPGEYAVFPGMEGVGESVISARLADSWEPLDPGPHTSLRLKCVYPEHSAGYQMDEHTLPSARWTDQGEIRRENDFRAMGTRHT